MDRDRDADGGGLRVRGAGTDLTLPVWLQPIETKRLRLVPPNEGHAEAFAEAAMESDDELSRWSRRTGEARTREGEIERAKHHAETTARGTRVQRYAFTRAVPEQLVCVVTIHPWLDPRAHAPNAPPPTSATRVDESPDLEIGTWCRTTMVGNGFASEAVNAVVSHALRDLRTRAMWIRVAESNAPSRRVAERLGFTLVERLAFPASVEWGEAATVLIMKREDPLSEGRAPSED